jgi:hypothetical protein
MQHDASELYVSKCCMIHLPLLTFGACIPKGSPAKVEACELVGERVAHLAGIQFAVIKLAATRQ